MADNLKYSKHKEIKGKKSYDRYDNYDAIEVPFTDSIPSDYDGVMGVPISFLDKYSPEQFEILGMYENEDLHKFKTKVYTTEECKQMHIWTSLGKQRNLRFKCQMAVIIIRDGILDKVLSKNTY